MHGLFETMPSPKAADLICLPLSLHFKLLKMCSVALPEVMTSGTRPAAENKLLLPEPECKRPSIPIKKGETEVKSGKS